MNESNQPAAKVQGHTPGPWIATYWSDRDEICISTEENGGGEWLADVKPLIDDDGQTQQSFNARLIAASPCLLGCLENAIVDSGFYISGPTHPYVCEDEGEPRWVGFARAAIAKARGQ